MGGNPYQHYDEDDNPYCWDCNEPILRGGVQSENGLYYHYECAPEEIKP